MAADKEEVIAEVQSGSWRCNMPVTLITWCSGKMNLHCQTGDHHPKALEVAKAILETRGLELGSALVIGGTGIYYEVTPLEQIQ